MSATRDAGFTLLELIVAAGILALIAVFSWRGLDTLIREREAIAQSQATIDLIQRSFARIERDALLASDAQLDDDGVLRLTTGNAPPGEASSTFVEYRLSSGALVRSVGGVDRAPLVLLDHVTALSIEAWQPVSGGGSWVKTKAATVEAPRPGSDANANRGPSGGTPGHGGDDATAQAPAASAGAAPFRGNGAPFVPGVARGSQRGPIVAAATGIRLTFAGTDGTRVTRSFMIGGS